jgi:hypothetical protein
MKPFTKLQQGKEALELIEEAIHLLRETPVSTLVSYYLGSCPFVLGLLYFWSDMSRSAFARHRLPAAAVGLTLLFLWMKGCQAIFARRLLAQLCGEPAPRCTLRRLARTALTQTLLQPTGLFLLPLALVILLPFGWAYAFYQNVTVLGAGDEPGVRRTFQRAWGQMLVWPRQNHILLFFLKLFGLFVLTNWMVAFIAVPYLLKSLLGVETPFSRVMQDAPALLRTVLNTTFFSALFGVTYLCLDPLIKTVYVLRCFYGESLQTGHDLRAELKSFTSGNKWAVAASLLLLLNLSLAPTLQAAPQPENPQSAIRNPQSPLSAPALDQSLDEVLRRREYAWRLPREKALADEAGPITGFIQNVWETIVDWVRPVGRWFRDLMQWISRWLRPRTSGTGSADGWATTLKVTLIALTAALIGLLAWILVRLWRQRQRPPREEVLATATPTPDVADESVGADRLPEDGWMKLARELLARGELRLALRAFYLSSLAHLAERGLISLATFKSNHDYEGEVQRRSHALPQLLELFAQNVSVFDRVWYGRHEVNRDLVDRFAGAVERIKAC